MDLVSLKLTKRGVEREVVAAYFAKHPKCTNREAAEALGLPVARVAWHLMALRKSA